MDDGDLAIILGLRSSAASLTIRTLDFYLIIYIRLNGSNDKHDECQILNCQLIVINMGVI